VTVTVTGPPTVVGGTQVGAYTYEGIQSIEPSTGSTAGGTTVTITGTGLANTRSVLFGTAPANFTQVSDTELQTVSPPGQGSQHIQVSTLDGGATPLTTNDTFTYADAAPPATDSAQHSAQAGHPALVAKVSAAVPAAAGASLAAEAAEYVYKVLPALDTFGSVVHESEEAAEKAGLSCESNLSALKSVLGIAAAGTAVAIATLVMPTVMTGIVGALILDEASLELLEPAVEVLVTRVAEWALDQGIDAAVDSAFSNACCPPDPGTASPEEARDCQPNLLTDPSGTVQDTNGNPVSGATVTILSSSVQSGPFTAVDPSSPGIQPATNPETTGADGVFHWDVAAGYYEVAATAPGCTSASDPTVPAAVIGPYPVPPPQTGLVDVMKCANEPPAPEPVIDALNTTSGPTTGGTTVIITGTAFTPAATVTFGGTEATHVIYLSPEALQVITPPGVGLVDTVVHTLGGPSATESADQFFYGNQPSITSVSPDTGPTTGATVVTLTGTGFSGATTVGFGGLPATNVKVISDTEIQATAPAEAAGTVDTLVITPAGGSATGRADQFTYTASGVASLSLAPASATITAGSSQAYTADGTDASGADLGDVTSAATFTITPDQVESTSPGAACTGASCGATAAGTYTVTGTDASATGTASLTVVAGAANSLTPSAGDGQSVTAGHRFPDQLAVTAVDSYGNPVPDTPVTFTVTGGSGSFAGQASVTASTNASGVAVAPDPLTAGNTAGALTVTASVPGTSATASFLEMVTAAKPYQADLSVKITAPASLKVGSTGTVSVTISSGGPAAAAPVWVSVLVSPALKITSSPGARRVGNWLLYEAASLQPGGQVTYTINVSGKSALLRTALIFAVALSPLRDPQPGNNIAIASVRLTPAGRR
jgi:hypothetical protein